MPPEYAGLFRYFHHRHGRCRSAGNVTFSRRHLLAHPGPFQTLPAYEDASITVDRNTITKHPEITTRFDGGRGLGMVRRMTVTVVRSDCVTEQEIRDNPKIGTSVTLTGTTTTDRVIVVLLMTSGDQYTVIDAGYPFPIKM